MADVFISYSRRDKDFVSELHTALALQNREAWVDWEDIPLTADWWQEIERGIEAANTFVFVLSADSVESKICYQEAEHAVKNHKRLVPIVRRDDFNSEQVHPSLRKHNWLFFQKEDDFEAAFCQLMKAIDTDLEHVQQHTRLLVKAIEWNGKNRNPDLLLRGSELESVIQWITQNAEKEPRSTQVQRDYIDASRKAENDRKEAEIQHQKREIQRQRVWLGAVTAALIAATGLGLLAFTQYRTAEARRKEVELSQIETLSTSADAYMTSNQGLEGLMQGLRAARKLQQIEGVDPETRMKVTGALQQALNRMRERNRFEGHQDQIWGISFSPDGQIIASASRDKTVKLWSLDGTNLATLSGHTEPCGTVSFSPDSQTIATGSYDQTIKLWNRSGKEFRTLKGHTAEVHSIQFSPDGQQMVSASSDGTLKFWTVEGKLIKSIIAHPGGTWSVSYSPNGQYLVSSGDDRTVKLWRSSGELLKTLNTHQDKVRRVAFSPNSKLIASGDLEGVLKLWNLEGKEIKSIDGHRGRAIWAVRFSPDGQTIATASNDNTVKFWNLEGDEVDSLTGFATPISSLSYSPDGLMIALGGRDNTVKLWNMNRPVLEHSDSVRDVRFSPDNEIVATASEDRTIKLWSIDGTFLRTLRGYESSIGWISFSPNGDIYSATDLGAIKLWNEMGEELKSLRGRGDFKRTSFSPDGQVFVTAREDGSVQLFNLNKKKLASFRGHTSTVYWVSFSPDSKILATPSDDGTVKLWTRGGQLLAVLRGHTAAVINATFSPDGKTIASASADKTIKLWSLNGQELKTLRGHTSKVNRVVFSPDGKMLASGSADNTVRLWSLNGTELAMLKGHSGDVLGLSFSSNGKLLATSATDDTAMLWNLSLEPLLIRTCHWLSNYLKHNPSIIERDRQLCDGVERDWMIEGEELAKEGDIEGAIACFREAIKRKPELTFVPKTKAQQIAAVIPLDQGEELAFKGELKGATEKFRLALQRYPELAFDPVLRAKQSFAISTAQKAETEANKGDIAKALPLYKKAQQLDPKVNISADAWNSLCWYGALKGYVNEVADVCEKGVALNPENGNILDSRGVIRALRGDFQGAIADFQAFVRWINDIQEPSANDKTLRNQRKRWIKELQAGRNPLTPEELKTQY